MLETSGLPRFDSAGRFLGYRGVHRDITARHRAEEALRVSEKRFRDIAENSGEWIWEMNAEGVYTTITATPVLKRYSATGRRNWSGGLLMSSLSRRTARR